MSRDHFLYATDKDVVRSPEVPMSTSALSAHLSLYPKMKPKLMFAFLHRNNIHFFQMLNIFSKVKTRGFFLAKGQPVIKRHARGETRKMQTFSLYFREPIVLILP